MIPLDPSDTLAVLRAAEAWLGDREHWTTWTYSRDMYGQPLGASGCFDGTAASTCPVGALMRAAGGRYTHAKQVLEEVLGEPIPVVNDGLHGYERSMAGFRKAIEKLEAMA